MPAFKSMKELCATLQTKVNLALKNDVTDAVRETEQIKADELVYSVYTPSWYDRTGALVADDSIIGTILDEDSGVLSVDNISEFSQNPPSANAGWGLAGLVEYGDGWNGHHYEHLNRDGDNPFTEPRPFIDETREELSDGRIVKAALKNGLRKGGLNVK